MTKWYSSKDLRSLSGDGFSYSIFAWFFQLVLHSLLNNSISWSCFLLSSCILRWLWQWTPHRMKRKCGQMMDLVISEPTLFATIHSYHPHTNLHSLNIKFHRFFIMLKEKRWHSLEMRKLDKIVFRVWKFIIQRKVINLCDYFFWWLHFLMKKKGRVDVVKAWRRKKNKEY